MTEEISSSNGNRHSVSPQLTPEDQDHLASFGNGEVYISSLTDGKLVAKYMEGDGHRKIGVYITSIISDHGSKINITSLDGQEILYVRHSEPASASLVRVMGHSIVIRKHLDNDEKLKMIDYTLSSEFTHHFDKAIKHHHIPEIFSHYLDEDSVNNTKFLAFVKLISSPEMDIVARACHALGDAGVLGFETEAALRLYSFVVRFVHMQHQYNVDPKSLHYPSSSLTTTESHQRQKRAPGVCPNLRRLYYKARPAARRNVRRRLVCGRCPVGQTCLGMCGPRCSVCWWFICGNNCCFHRGCYEHDLCCLRKGYFHPSCYNPFRHFSCSSYRCN